MSDEWWDTPVEIEAEAGPPAVRKPRELDEVQKYRMPSTVTAKWVEAQLTKKEWADIKRTQTSLKLNPYLIDSMCRDAKKGLSKRSIMARAGYNVQTWDRWEEKAAAGQQPYALWYSCMMLSISTVEEDLVDTIRLQAQSDWKAGKWLLEQLNKDEYSPTPKNQIVNVAGDVHAETTTSVNYMDDQKALEVAKLLQGFGVIPQIENVIEGEVIEDASDDPDPEGA